MSATAPTTGPTAVLTTGPTAGPAAAVHAAIGPAVAAAGFVLEGVGLTRAGRRSVVAVVVDLPDEATGSLDLDQVAVVARAVSAVLDDPAGDSALESVLGATPYVLEVSSPGVDRPLTQRRHWARARGRLVTLTGAGGDAMTGRVERVDDAGVLLGESLLSWEALAGAAGRVQVEFSRVDEADATGDDTTDDGTDSTEED